MRKLIAVFNNYGIPVTGCKKLLSFKHDFKVENYYVNAILFEIENDIQVVGNKHGHMIFERPLDIIQFYINGTFKIKKYRYSSWPTPQEYYGTRYN